MHSLVVADCAVWRFSWGGVVVVEPSLDVVKSKMQGDGLGPEQRSRYAFRATWETVACAGSSRVLGSLFESDACLCWDCDVGLG